MKILPSSLSLSQQKKYYVQCLIGFSDIYFDFQNLSEIISEYALTFDPDSNYIDEFFGKIQNGTLNIEDLETYLIDIDINICDQKGFTGLMKACSGDYIHTEIISFLLSHGADPNIQHKKIGYTALMYLCKNQNENIDDIISLLLSSGANVNLKNKLGDTSLLSASFKNNPRVLSLLISNGAEIDAQNKFGQTSLILSCYDNLYDNVALLLSAGANVDIQDKEGWTSLIFAIHSKSTDIVKLLLDHGANINISDYSGKTALIHATLNESIEMVSLLLNYGLCIDINIQNNSGSTALIEAIKNCNEDIVKLLIQHGAQIEISDNDGISTIEWANYCDNNQIKYLLKVE